MNTEKICNIVGICSVLLIPIIFAVVYLVKGRVTAVHAFIFGFSDLGIVRYLFPISIFAASPLIFLIFFEIQGSLQSALTWLFFLAGYIPALVLVVFLIAPILHYSRSPSIYQYLEDRYHSKPLRWVCAGLFLLISGAYAIMILALITQLASQLVEVKSYYFCAVFGFITILPILTGGLTAALDLCTVLGFCTSFAAFCAIFGLNFVWKNTFFPSQALSVNFDVPVFTSEPSVLSSILFSFFVTLHMLSANQIWYQAYASIPLKKKAILALIGSLPIFAVLVVVAALGALGMVAPWWIHDCLETDSRAFFDKDNITENNPPQNFSTYLKMLCQNYNGVAGLILGGFISLLLAKFAFVVLSMATVIWEDFVRVFFTFSKEKRQLQIIRTLIVFLTLVNTAVAVWILIEVPDYWRYSKTFGCLLGCISAPLTAVFIAGIFVPCSNSKGAFAGLAIGLAFNLWLSVGYMIYVPKDFDSKFYSLRPYNSYCTNWTTFGNSSEFYNHRAGESAIVQSDLDANITIDLLDAEWTHDQTTEYEIFTNFSSKNSTNLPSNLAPKVYQFTIMLQPALGFCLTFLVITIFSLITGGKDIYSLDWNLVFCTCNDWTERFSPTEAPPLRRRQKPRQRGAYVNSESFRYAPQGPLPDSNYQNPRVQYLQDGDLHSITPSL